ncbi:MAG: hypothetical protein ACR2JW_07860 [Thermomicrobiales bacterium]
MRSSHRPLGIVLTLMLFVGSLNNPGTVGAFSGFGQSAKYALVDGANTDTFGASLGLSGSGGTMIVGAPRRNARGAAYIYTSASNQPAQLTPSDATSGDSIGAPWQ